MAAAEAAAEAAEAAEADAAGDAEADTEAATDAVGIDIVGGMRAVRACVKREGAGRRVAQTSSIGVKIHCSTESTQ